MMTHTPTFRSAKCPSILLPRKYVSAPDRLSRLHFLTQYFFNLAKAFFWRSENYTCQPRESENTIDILGGPPFQEL